MEGACLWGRTLSSSNPKLLMIRTTGEGRTNLPHILLLGFNQYQIYLLNLQKLRQTI